TIGNFDGVHLGHQRLLGQTRQAADRLGGDAVVMTFEPHPATYLAPDRLPPRLSLADRKYELLAALGIDVCIAENFGEEFAAITAAEFTEDILGKLFGVRHLVVGDDFRYGTGRLGDIESLRKAGIKHNFTVEVIEPVTSGEHRASSSAIRRALIEGNLSLANTLLGRDYDVDGVVVRGAGRGREIGVPTANIDAGGVLLPRPGIYATRVTILESGEEYMAATSLGTNPTFVLGGALTLEPHLLDFDSDLYGKRLRVSFVKHIRDEERFDSLDALLAQIHSDIEQTRKLLQ
ncbi:MAG: bifunctional riboflavin kinase/FAD synthetase, partial [Kofleriaceae bacterium]|nr:bifunctional riboflavin kinase/FAD synthetase [Kofleriaceae bacterium]